MERDKEAGTTKLSQPSLIDDIQLKFQLTNCKQAPTPMETGAVLDDPEGTFGENQLVITYAPNHIQFLHCYRISQLDLKKLLFSSLL
ncbi:hypothetical protein HK096_009626, partial [Nowakowskiella sp. JEL0078]